MLASINTATPPPTSCTLPAPPSPQRKKRRKAAKRGSSSALRQQCVTAGQGRGVVVKADDARWRRRDVISSADGVARELVTVGR